MVLVDNGFREVVLTGIHLGHYGVDFNKGKPKTDWTRLSGLVREICKLSPDLRVRLSSIEATEVTRELIEVMQEYSDQVCPHLHVCVQSGSDRILRFNEASLDSAAHHRPLQLGQKRIAQTSLSRQT